MNLVFIFLVPLVTLLRESPRVTQGTSDIHTLLHNKKLPEICRSETRTPKVRFWALGPKLYFWALKLPEICRSEIRTPKVRFWALGPKLYYKSGSNKDPRWCGCRA